MLDSQNTVSPKINDIRMLGELSGYDLVMRPMITDHSDIKVLMTCDESFIEAGIQQGVLNQTVKMLPKPYSMKKLAIVLHEVLASAE